MALTSSAARAVIRPSTSSRSSTSIRSDAVANTLRRRSFIASSWRVSAVICPEGPASLESGESSQRTR